MADTGDEGRHPMPALPTEEGGLADGQEDAGAAVNLGSTTLSPRLRKQPSLRGAAGWPPLPERLALLHTGSDGTAPSLALAPVGAGRVPQLAQVFDDGRAVAAPSAITPATKPPPLGLPSPVTSAGGDGAPSSSARGQSPRAGTTTAATFTVSRKPRSSTASQGTATAGGRSSRTTSPVPGMAFGGGTPGAARTTGRGSSRRPAGSGGAGSAGAGSAGAGSAGAGSAGAGPSPGPK
jgi:hypothetical protein